MTGVTELQRRSGFAETMAFVPEGGQMLVGRGLVIVPLLVILGFVTGMVILGLIFAGSFSILIARILVVARRTKNRFEP